MTVNDAGAKRTRPHYAAGQGEAVRWVRLRVKYPYDGCLLWPFNRCRGYGILSINGQQLRVNRYMCELAHGPAPTPEYEAAHLCGNPACANPRHLAWKTRTENQADRHIHGTAGRGVGPRFKLTPAGVAEIKAKKGIETQAVLAARFGVHETTIGQIHRGKIWLTGERRVGGFADPSHPWISRLRKKRDSDANA